MLVQVSFADGLDKLASRITDKRRGGGGDATLFEKYMQRKKERREAQRALGRFAQIDSGSDSDGAGAGRRRGPAVKGAPAQENDSGGDAGPADGFDDPFFQVCACRNASQHPLGDVMCCMVCVLSAPRRVANVHDVNPGKLGA